MPVMKTSSFSPRGRRRRVVASLAVISVIAFASLRLVGRKDRMPCKQLPLAEERYGG